MYFIECRCKFYKQIFKSDKLEMFKDVEQDD